MTRSCKNWWSTREDGVRSFGLGQLLATDQFGAFSSAGFSAAAPLFAKERT